MKVQSILILVTALSASAWAGSAWAGSAWAGSAWAGGWQVTKPLSGGEYVLCQGEDCPARTVKVIDIDEGRALASRAIPVVATARIADLVLQFGLGSARLSLADKAKITAWGALVPPAGRIVVMGSTDRIGTRGFNRRLADGRAKAVAQALEASGVARGQMRLDAQCCIGHPPSNNPKVRRVTVRVQDMEMK